MEMIDSWGRVVHSKTIGVNLDEKYILWLEQKGKKDNLSAGKTLKKLIIEMYECEKISQGGKKQND